MREIKFRAWDKKNKKWLDGNETGGTHILLNGEIGYYDRGCWDWWTPYTDVELMQYTGLHDKQGREIYEGDVVKADPDTYDSYICIIESLERAFFRKYDDQIHFDYNKCEVLGNIYENPELLEVKR